MQHGIQLQAHSQLHSINQQKERGAGCKGKQGAEWQCTLLLTSAVHKPYKRHKRSMMNLVKLNALAEGLTSNSNCPSLVAEVVGKHRVEDGCIGR